MSKQILVNSSHYETRVALLENGEIRALHIEREEDRNVVGNVYKGVVKRVLPGMQAAFLELGLERTAFLYVDDIVQDPFGSDVEVEEDETDEGNPDDLESGDWDKEITDEDGEFAVAEEGEEPNAEVSVTPANVAPEPKAPAAKESTPVTATPVTATPSEEGASEEDLVSADAIGVDIEDRFDSDDDDDEDDEFDDEDEVEALDEDADEDEIGEEGPEDEEFEEGEEEEGEEEESETISEATAAPAEGAAAEVKAEAPTTEEAAGPQNLREAPREGRRPEGRSDERYDEGGGGRRPSQQGGRRRNRGRRGGRNRNQRQAQDRNSPRDNQRDQQRDDYRERDNRDRDSRDTRANYQTQDRDRDRDRDRDQDRGRDRDRDRDRDYDRDQNRGQDRERDFDQQDRGRARDLDRDQDRGRGRDRERDRDHDRDNDRDYDRSENRHDRDDDRDADGNRASREPSRGGRDNRDREARDRSYNDRGGVDRNERGSGERNDRNDRNDRGGSDRGGNRDRNPRGRGGRNRNFGRERNNNRRGGGDQEGRGGGGSSRREPRGRSRDNRRGRRPPRRPRERANIQDLLKEGQEILVQVAKAPIGTKGARLTTHISLPGRNLVLMPTVKHIGISRRIGHDRERRRLRDMFTKKIRPRGVGFIIRTVAENKSFRELKADTDYLVKMWMKIKRESARKKAPALIHEDLSLAMRAVRDFFTDDVDQFIIDDPSEYENVLAFIGQFMPRLKGRVKLFKGPSQLFEHYGIEAEISRALGKKVWLKSGGYLLVDQSEALTAIDVNTGRYVGSKSLEETILKTNLEAVKEVAYQLRIRNIGGIIIIDLIDMENTDNREKVFAALQEALGEDRARTNILKISDLGLVEMTRKRTHEDLVRYLTESCTNCEGRGYHKSRRTVCFEIFREIEKESLGSTKNIVVFAHPDVTQKMLGDEKEHVTKLEERFTKQILIRPDPMFHIEQFEVFGKN